MRVELKDVAVSLLLLRLGGQLGNDLRWRVRANVLAPAGIASSEVGAGIRRASAGRLPRGEEALALGVGTGIRDRGVAVLLLLRRRDAKRRGRVVRLGVLLEAAAAEAGRGVVGRVCRGDATGAAAAAAVLFVGEHGVRLVGGVAALAAADEEEGEAGNGSDASDGDAGRDADGGAGGELLFIAVGAGSRGVGRTGRRGSRRAGGSRGRRLGRRRGRGGGLGGARGGGGLVVVVVVVVVGGTVGRVCEVVLAHLERRIGVVAGVGHGGEDGLDLVGVVLAEALGGNDGKVAAIATEAFVEVSRGIALAVGLFGRAVEATLRAGRVEAKVGVEGEGGGREEEEEEVGGDLGGHASWSSHGEQCEAEARGISERVLEVVVLLGRQMRYRPEEMGVSEGGPWCYRKGQMPD